MENFDPSIHKAFIIGQFEDGEIEEVAIDFENGNDYLHALKGKVNLGNNSSSLGVMISGQLVEILQKDLKFLQ